MAQEKVMKQQELINQLLANAAPVRRLWPPLPRALSWWLGTSVCMAGYLWLFARPAMIQQAMTHTDFVIQGILALVLGLVAALAALTLSIPGRRPAVLQKLPYAGLFGWLAVLFYALATTAPSLFMPGWGCAAEIFIFSAIPAALLIVMAKRAAPLNLPLVGFFAVLAAASMGTFCTQFSCCKTAPLHGLVWHFLPVLVLSMSGIFFGRRLLRWM